MKTGSVEVWRNNANGPRWYHVFDPAGREVTKLVNPRRTFTVTPFERQINQGKAADPNMDLFRNGTFTLEQAADDTIKEEVQSVDALTESEINALVFDILGDPKTAEKRLARFKSAVTVNRIFEALVVADAPQSVINVAKAKVQSFEAVVPQEHVVVSTAPASVAERGPKMPNKPVAARK